MLFFWKGRELFALDLKPTSKEHSYWEELLKKYFQKFSNSKTLNVSILSKKANDRKIIS